MKRREFVLGSTAFALFAGGLARAQAPKGKRAVNPFDRAAEVVGESGLTFNLPTKVSFARSRILFTTGFPTRGC